MVRATARWSIEDYHHMIDSGLLAGRQVELIEGQILDLTPERPIHRATYRRGVKYLEALLGDRAVVFASADCIGRQRAAARYLDCDATRVSI